MNCFETMSDRPPVGSRLPTRRFHNVQGEYCFWTDTSSTGSPSSNSNGTLMSSEDRRRLSGSVSSNVFEGERSAISSGRRSARRNKREQNASHEQCEEVNNNRVVEEREQGETSKEMASDSDNKLVHTALELAWSLFGPNTTVVKTLQVAPGYTHSDSEGHSIHLPGSGNGINGSSALKKEIGGAFSKRSASDGELFLRSTTCEAVSNNVIPVAFHINAYGENNCATSGIPRTACEGTSENDAVSIGSTSATSFNVPRSHGIRAQLRTVNAGSKSPTNGAKNAEGDKGNKETLRQRNHDLIEEYFQHCGDLCHLKPQFGRRDQIWQDRYYYEYYQYLCKGIKRALAYPGSFSLDCEAGNVHTPANQQATGICKAIKSDLYYQYNPGSEIYSRKVFAGGLPIDIDEDELSATFSSFGPLVVDWPNKNENNSYFPPKGYVFLIFEYEVSVRALVQSCFVEDEKLFLYISSPLSPDKLVQIRPWRLADADYVVDPNISIWAHRAVFVGGVPRPIKAVELAHIMDRLYGSVACAGIDTDVEYKYPKGAGRVVFTNRNSYMKAIADRYVQLSHGEVEKTVEIKPYVLDDQPCDECGGERCGYRPAPFFCPHLSCLQYYCEKCWESIHASRAREDHKPLVKEA
uniref:Cytoplasmic polyadenylation element-binding protein 1 n=1 Tax=Ascaris lumbricoides TaxID=6252 RepID=A0A0M3HF10_ASCLU